MSNSILVNMCGDSVPVYSSPDLSSNIVGEIIPREIYGFNRNWGGDYYFCNIIFRDGSGSVRYGFLIDPSYKAMTDCTDYPYESNVDIHLL